MNNDLQNNIRSVVSVTPLAIGANGTKTGTIVDRKGFNGVQFVATYGSVTTTGTVCTLVIREGDVTGTMTSVADADLIGTEALASLTAGTPRTAGVNRDVSRRVGYIGNKRYVQALVVQTGVTSVGCVSVNAILFNPHVAPTSNP
jgi:hypothetical protein